MAVRAETEMDKIEHRRRAGDLFENVRIAFGLRSPAPATSTGIAWIWPRAQRRMLKQAFIQVREVSIGVSPRRDALVHLHYMYGFPGNIFVR